VTNPNPNPNRPPKPTPHTTRTTLGRFDIQAEADLHAAVVNVQFNKQLRESFGTAEVAMIATVVSELGRNILKYGGGRGYLLVVWIDDGAGRNQGVEVKAVDYGPGFLDPEGALKDHFSTGGTLGLGLPGAAGIMDTLEIESRPGAGATVTARKWVKTRGR
jgi:serine/threonine-protein kinase RsbT